MTANLTGMNSSKINMGSPRSGSSGCSQKNGLSKSLFSAFIALLMMAALLVSCSNTQPIAVGDQDTDTASASTAQANANEANTEDATEIESGKADTQNTDAENGESGGEDSESDAEQAADGSGEAGEETSERLVTDLTRVENATFKVYTQGEIRPPGSDMSESTAGIGTGFMISEDGIAVTNNHVVVGAETLEVFFQGDNQSYPARILGTSECSDLAVIKVEGSGFDFLDFYDGEVRPGLDVYAAGFPATDVEYFEDADYTLTRGIVSNTTASGDTEWTSVRQVVEHDAKIRPGNSGGPLVTSDGEVVGVNFAVFNEDDFNYAILASDVSGVIDELTSGDTESIGINGEAVVSGEINGIWVAGVTPNSIAETVGLRSGDLILRIDGREVGSDGTQRSYCEVVRNFSEQNPVPIEVLRLETEELLSGELFGQPLSASEAGSDRSNRGDLPAYENYQLIRDTTGLIEYEVPVEWSQRTTSNEGNLAFLRASPDLEGFLGGWASPGVSAYVYEITSSTASTAAEALDEWQIEDSCEVGQRSEIALGDDIPGLVQEFNNCGLVNSELLAFAFVSPDGTKIFEFVFQIVDERDRAAYERASSTLVVTNF